MFLSLFSHRSQTQRKVRRAHHEHGGRRSRFEPLEDRALLSFTPMTNYDVGRNPQGIVAADFNNDSHLDLATANLSDGSISLLRGNDNGTFQPAQNIAGGGGRSIAVGDFNGDDMLDLLTSNGTSVSVLIRNGDATFLPPVSTPMQGIGDSISMAVGDFNDDGLLDVAVETYSYYWGGPTGTQVQVLLGDGDGRFTQGDLHSVPRSIRVPLAVADVNDDDRPDVLVGSEDSMLVSVLLANPDGTLSYAPGVSDFATGNRTRFVSVADFTGDGIPDVFTAGYTLGAAVLPGRGDGTFAARIVTISNSYAEWAGAAGDFDRDGNVDVVLSSGQASEAGVLFTLLGQGDGTFSEIKPDHSVGELPIEIAAGDFNGDGWLDVATVNAFGSVSVLLNDQSWPVPLDSISISDATVTEGNTGTTNATFTVTLSNAVGADVTVAYNTANGSALAGSDYTAASGTVTIPAGQTTRTFTVAVLGDRLAEPTETFLVNLSAPTSGVTIGDGLGVGTILDNEPRISITDVSATEGNSRQSKSFTFTISLSNAYDQAVTVNYATANGTATAGSDYQAKSGTVTFAPGETTKTITVAVTSDKITEANETFFVNLSGAVGGEITDSQGLGTILNDDGGRSRNRFGLFALAVDTAFEDWMSTGRKRRGW
jgi:hypothetical protein